MRAQDGPWYIVRQAPQQNYSPRGRYNGRAPNYQYLDKIMRSPLLPLFISMLIVACAPQGPDASSDSASGSGIKAESAPDSMAAEFDPDDLGALKARLQANIENMPIESISKTPMPGLYEIQSGLNFAYVSLDGRYLIEGDLNDMFSGRQLTEDRRKTQRSVMLAGIPEDQSILYAPEKDPAKYTVTVFTDIDCGYCRLLHKSIKEYNDAGIAVKYLFFPRSGPNTESFHKAEAVWCAEDRQAALTQAKVGGGYEGARSCSNPVMSHLQMAADLGIRGTPAIILPNGAHVPGYRPPAELVKILAEHQVAATPG